MHPSGPWLATIYHADETDMFRCASPGAAWHLIASAARERWDELPASGGVTPDSDGEAIETFFRHQGRERFTITRALTAEHRAGEGLPDADTLDFIAEMLRDPEWGVGMLEDIRDLVDRSGRSTEGYSDGRPTWVRH